MTTATAPAPTASRIASSSQTIRLRNKPTNYRGDSTRQCEKQHKAGAQEAVERRKASVRAKVEHPFLYVKRHFGYAKVRYRGLAKNTQRIAVPLGFSNLLIAGRYAVA